MALGRRLRIEYLEVPLNRGTWIFFRGVLADPAPVSTAVPTKTLVAADTDLNDIDADTYFSATTDAKVTVVNEQNLSGAGNKTVAEDLSIYTDALTLTVTPASEAGTDERCDARHDYHHLRQTQRDRQEPCR